MGIRLRKSITMGPIRFTLSKSGVGCSIGIPGYRKSLHSSGRLQTTISLPGTGISHVTTETLGLARENSQKILDLADTNSGTPSPQADSEAGDAGVTSVQRTGEKTLRIVTITAIWGFSAALRYVAWGQSTGSSLDAFFVGSSIVCASLIGWIVFRRKN